MKVILAGQSIYAGQLQIGQDHIDGTLYPMPEGRS
jgi:hypothetical protein